MSTKRHISTLTPNILSDRLHILHEHFPEVFTEEKVDFGKLRDALGDSVETGLERYSFTWAGKRDAIRLLQTPTRATLLPARAESVAFDTTQNIFIEGDNLEVLKLLYKPYFGRVKLIYIDPPYNTGNDFIYPDNFADPLGVYLQFTGQQDSEGNLLTSNPESSGRYHSAWLSMMYPRLFLARQLLREDGFIVVSIDDAELSNLRIMLTELFGEENFISVLVWDRNRKNDAKFFSVGHEYMVIFARNKQYLKDNEILLRTPKEGLDDLRSKYETLRVKYGDAHIAVAKELREWFATIKEGDARRPLVRFNKVDERGPFRDDGDINWPGGGGPMYDVIHPITGKPCKKPKGGWRFPTKTRMDEEIAKGYVVFGLDESTIPSLKRYAFEKTEEVMRSVHFSYAQTAAVEFDKIFNGIRVFDNPKHYIDLSQIIEYLTNEGDLVLDFFGGSCSTAHAVFNTNRNRGSARCFICVQLQEPVNTKTSTGRNAWELGLKTISDIGKERIRRVIVQMKESSKGQLPLLPRSTPEDLGFRVYKLAASNFKPWVGVPAADLISYTSQMALFRDSLVEGWTADGVLSELILKQGFSLASSVETIHLSDAAAPDTGLDVYKVTDPTRGQTFYITFEVLISADIAITLGLSQDDVLICRDTALDDETAANLALQCRLETI